MIIIRHPRLGIVVKALTHSLSDLAHLYCCYI